jgi:hypothetical protein
MNVEPVSHSDIDGHGNGGQITVAKLGGRHYAFIGHMLGMGTSILDVTDPRSPEVIAQIPIGDNNHSHKVRVCGDLILVNREQLGSRPPHEAGLKIYDVSDPSSPEEVSFFETGGKGVHKYWVDCEKRIAYIATEDEGYHEAFFMAVDFSVPEEPREVSRWWLPGQHLAGGEKPSWDTGRYSYRLHHPVVLGDRAYLGYWDTGVVILDISDLECPELVSHRCYTPPYGGAFHTAMPVDRRIGGRDWMVVFQESLAPYNKEGLKLMWMMDISEEENPITVSTFSVPTEGFDLDNGRLGPHQPHEDLKVTDDLIYASWFNAGLRVVSIADPFRPVEVGHHIPPVPEA